MLGPWKVCMNGSAHFCRLYLFVRFSLGVGYGKDPESLSQLASPAKQVRRQVGTVALDRVYSQVGRRVLVW